VILVDDVGFGCSEGLGYDDGFGCASVRALVEFGLQMLFHLVVAPEQGAGDWLVDGASFIVLGSVQFMCAK
jgi:hypothetical protein